MDQESEAYVAEHREVEINFPEVNLAGHQLIPKGPMLVCVSCPYEHSYHLDPKLIYKGLDKDGLPITERL